MKEEIIVEMVFNDIQSFNEQISEYEKQYNAKLIDAIVEDGKARVRFLYPIGKMDGERVAVSVWDCRARLWIGQKEEGMLNLTEEQKEAIEKWKEYVIYTENGGAINWSGIYLPSPFAVQILKQILRGKVDAVNKIAEPTKEDFQKKVKLLLRALKKGYVKGVEIYNSAIRCHDGCRGYHLIQWLEYKNGQYEKYETGCHHAMLTHGMWDKAFVKTLTKEEAMAEICEWLEELAEKYCWTKYELMNADLSYEYQE